MPAVPKPYIDGKKQCSKCREYLILDNFGKDKNRHDGLKHVCKSCRSSLEKTSKYTNIARKSRARRRQLAKQCVFGYLLTHPCVHCGETDPVVLQFDHIDPSTKTECVAILMHKNFPPQTIMNEIEKCQVLCANCHTRKTAKQFNWYSDLSIEQQQMYNISL